MTAILKKQILMGCISMTILGCSTEKKLEPGRETAPAASKKMVGELERLGKNRQDFLVLGVDAPGFQSLSLQQKTLIYYLYRAAIAGHTIFDDQNHRHAREIRDLLEAIYLYSDGLDPAVRAAVHDYLKYVWINHGPYDHDSHVKTLPNDMTPEMLRQAALHAQNKGARFEPARGETLEVKLERLRPTIFDAGFEPLQTNQKRGDDIIATSFVNLYDHRLTQRHIDGAPAALKQRLNVRLGLDNGNVAPEVYQIGGLYGEDLETVSHFLRLALPFAESEEQRKGLESLLEHYATGDEEKFREYSVHWLRSDTVVDYLNGFVETYMDPRGVIGQFEANVSFVSDSTLLDRLANNALYFEKKMPWPDEFKLEKINKPVANVVNVVVETGDSGPVSPAAYNLPNYADIRRDHGSKNIVLLNIEEARSEEVRQASINEFYLPEYRAGMFKHGDRARQWEVYMHEVIGHGSGKPAASLKVDPAVAIGRAYSSLEECRADLVALYHVFDPKLVEIGAFTREEQPEIARTMYILYLQGQVNRYRMYEDDLVREAHQRGSQLILHFLLEGGPKKDQDYGVRVTQKDGNYYVELVDLHKAHRGVGEALETLQVIKSHGDGHAASQIFELFGTHVNRAWRENVRARAAKLKLPNKTAFVFPRLEPVMEGDRIKDVRLHVDEDLTAQQIRFSRLRFNKQVPE